jgi:hypothetical protein
MSDSLMSMPQGDLEAALMRSFTDGVEWPPDAASLTALLDIGLTAEEVARHFRVEPDEVRRAFEQAHRPTRK